MEVKRNGGNGRRSICVRTEHTLYTSGITSTQLNADVKTQAKDIFKQMEKILDRYRSDKSSIIMATIYLADMADYGAFNAVWDEWIVDGFEPCRSVVEAKLATDEYKVKISLVAAL